MVENDAVSQDDAAAQAAAQAATSNKQLPSASLRFPPPSPTPFLHTSAPSAFLRRKRAYLTLLYVQDDPLKKPKRRLMPWMVDDDSLLSTAALAPAPNKPLLPASASASAAAAAASAATAATAPEAVVATAEIDPEAAVNSPGPGLALAYMAFTC